MTTRDAWRAALATAFFSFVTLFGLAALSWLQDVWTWASGGTAALFPDPSVLYKAAVAATVSALIGLVNFAVRWAQSKTGVAASTTPTYPRA